MTTHDLPAYDIPQQPALCDVPLGSAGDCVDESTVRNLNARFMVKIVLWASMIVGAAIFTWTMYGLFAGDIQNPDLSVYSTTARRLLAGQRPYVDFFESKPPLVTLLYAIPAYLAPRSYIALSRFLAIILLFQAGVWLLAFRPTLTTAATALPLTLALPACTWDFAWLSTEHFANCFVVVVLALSYGVLRNGNLAWWRLLLAGAAVTAAFHCRQNTAVVAVVPLFCVFAAPATRRIKLKAVLFFASGGLLAWLLVLAIVYCISDLSSYFYHVFVYPRRFKVPDGRSGLEVRLALLGKVASTPLATFLGLCAALAILGPYRRLALLTLPIALAISLAVPRDYGHYMVGAMPFMTFALLVGLPKDRPRTRVLEKVALAAVLSGVSVGMLWMQQYFRPGPTRLEALNDVAQWIDDNSDGTATIYVYGEIMHSDCIQYFSRLSPANKYAVCWEIDRLKDMFQDSSDNIIRSYVQHPPTWFVVQDGFLQPVLASQSNPNAEALPSFRLAVALFRQWHYEDIRQLHDFHVYRLRGEKQGQKD